MEYWQECVEAALEETDVIATPEQIKIIAAAVEGGAENFGMYSGHEHIPDPRDAEIDRLKGEVEQAKRKYICKRCDGRGESHLDSGKCWGCGGVGLVKRQRGEI